MWPVLFTAHYYITANFSTIAIYLIIVVVLYKHCTQHATLGGGKLESLGGEAGKFGGEASLLPPPLDRTLFRCGKCNSFVGLPSYMYTITADSKKEVKVYLISMHIYMNDNALHAFLLFIHEMQTEVFVKE